ncbi:hypothetical protein EYF80_053199 [Liparis tanakae]|uniref:Uncharacterized protein n=1 Tax=Liparis tanakae TaxID=230148 RepID=A0A4Z2F6Y7_9TELE|nr:hypothetical protein EYF80_053199 [Liparis tanakae]
MTRFTATEGKLENNDVSELSSNVRGDSSFIHPAVAQGVNSQDPRCTFSSLMNDSTTASTPASTPASKTASKTASPSVYLSFYIFL